MRQLIARSGVSMTRAGALVGLLLSASLGATPARAETEAAGPVTLAIERGNSASIMISRAGDALGAPIELRSSARSDAAGTGLLSGPPPRGMPVHGSAVTSRFGMRRHPIAGGTRMHSGVDLAAPAGAPVVAAADGVVSFANWNGGYGLLVTLRHGNGFETRFAHLSQILVAPGQRVTRGQLVGRVGSTGRSTGSHLHYEVRRDGRAIDPLH